jgi:maltokinase
VTVAPGASAALLEAIATGTVPTGHDLRTYVPLPPVAGDEHPITVDQTNTSVMVGGQVVVKWMREPQPNARAPRLLSHLAEAGFTRMPPPHAALFRDGALIALVTGFLPEAEDGWDWCTNALLSWLDGATPRPDFAPALGTLAADLHAALATPTSSNPHPLSPPTPTSALTPPAPSSAPTPPAPPPAPPSTLTPAAPSPPSSAPTPAAPPSKAGELPRSLGEALAYMGDDADGVWLRSVADRIAGDISALSGYHSRAPRMELHGDLHVGQVLRWRGGYAVTDFDGNPTVASRPEPVVRDLAQLRTSVLHVAEIANRRTEGRHRAALLDWGRSAADDLLTAYRAGLAAHGFAHLLDEKPLRPLEVEQECRELIYAARFLPRWRYAPMGVLRSWYG